MFGRGPRRRGTGSRQRGRSLEELTRLALALCHLSWDHSRPARRRASPAGRAPTARPDRSAFVRVFLAPCPLPISTACSASSRLSSTSTPIARSSRISCSVLVIASRNGRDCYWHWAVPSRFRPLPVRDVERESIDSVQQNIYSTRGTRATRKPRLLLR